MSYPLMLRASKQNIFLYITEYVENPPDQNKQDSTMTRVQSIEFLSNITVFVCLLVTIFTNLLTNQNNKFVSGKLLLYSVCRPSKPIM